MNHKTALLHTEPEERAQQKVEFNAYEAEALQAWMKNFGRFPTVSLIFRYRSSNRSARVWNRNARRFRDNRMEDRCWLPWPKLCSRWCPLFLRTLLFSFSTFQRARPAWTISSIFSTVSSKSLTKAFFTARHSYLPAWLQSEPNWHSEESACPFNGNWLMNW